MPRRSEHGSGRPDAMAAAAAKATTPARLSSSERAYRELRQRILDNRMPAGAQYLEQELAAALSMSRTPVREALIRLAEELLVEVRPRHGVRVLPISAVDMAEIYEILTELEAAAARRAAERPLNEIAIAGLERAVMEMDQSLAADDLVAWAIADERFHRGLVELGGNKRLEGVVHLFMDQVHRARMQTLRLRPRPTASNRDHAAVVEAIRDRDPATAYRIHRRHRESSREMLVKLLTRLGLDAL